MKKKKKKYNSQREDFQRVGTAAESKAKKKRKKRKDKGRRGTEGSWKQ